MSTFDKVIKVLEITLIVISAIILAVNIYQALYGDDEIHIPRPNEYHYSIPDSISNPPTEDSIKPDR